MTNWLEGLSPAVLRALHWTLSGSEEAKRQALLRPLVEELRSGLAVVLAEEADSGAAASPGAPAGKTSKPKRKLQKAQLRLQNAKGLQTPLHWLCARDVLEGAELGGWPSASGPCPASLARALAKLWAEQLLLPDVLGLLPVSYLTPPICEDHLPHSPQRELLVTVLQSLEAWTSQLPEAVLRALTPPEARRSLDSALQRLAATGDGSQGLRVDCLQALLRPDCQAAARGAAQAAALECREQRRDARRLAQQDVRARLAALRRAAGPARGAASGGRSSADWPQRRAAYEERLAQLRFELGRVPERELEVQEVTEPAPGTDYAPAPLREPQGASEAEALVALLQRQRLGGAANALRQALGAAVERLAVDLYEMESHFVYELVQNADDNRYGDVSPWLRLELCQDEGASFFFSVNNEVGLSAQDLRALCDVNASSKKGQKGVTGHKGIGWKSCFQVSDCPYMLSGCFTIKFDLAAHGKMGFVTPSWVDDKELASLPAAVQDAYYAGNTVTYLPLRSGAEAGVELALADLEESRPCLLFLRRLRHLELHSSKRRVSLDCEEEGPHHQAVLLRDDEGVERRCFLVYRHNVRLEQKEVCLTLAFPKQEDPGKLPPQALYCTLPVRKLSFGFCVEGPFELVASRGDIHEGSRVNQALCRALPGAFAGALEMHPDLQQRALAFLGLAPASPFWRVVHSSLSEQLQGTACVPLEDGGLERPENCLLRPSGGSALEAARLLPPALLWLGCRRRLAAPNSGAHGLEELGFQHWLQILRHRDEGWPQGLLGSWLEKEEFQAFKVFFAYLGEVLSSAEDPAEVLQQLWAVELLPADCKERRLFGLSEGPVFCRGPEAALDPAVRRLCEEGVLRVLHEAAWRPGAFLSAACAPLTAAALMEACARHHTLESLTPEVAWTSLSMLQSLFLKGEQPTSGWRALGEVLWLPVLGRGLARAQRLVCCSYLGCPAASLRRAALPWPLRFVDPWYLEGCGLGWEAFLEQLGVHTLQLAPASARIQALPSASSNSRLPRVEASRTWAQRKLEALQRMPLAELLGSVQRPQLGPTQRLQVPEECLGCKDLGARLVSVEWWRELLQRRPAFQYLQRCLAEDHAELRKLWVHRPGAELRQVWEFLLQGSDLAQLAGHWLPVAQFPEGDEEARGCLLQLVLSKATPENLLRCLRALERCQDVGVYVAMYRRLNSSPLAPEQLDELRSLLFVPGSGMLAASGCSWHSTPLLELAEVAVLDVHYARHGLEDFFAGLLQPEFQFDCPTLLHALRRLVERVHSGEAALPGGHELDGLLEMATEIYSQLAACLKTEPSEVQGLRRAFRTERLVLLRPKLRSHPKRLMPEEAWWDTHPELSELESVQSLSLKNFYQDLRDFFLALGVHQEITRAALKALLERPTQVSSSRWTGLDVSDVEDLGLLQTSSNFRPPDWRAPDEEEAPEQAPQRGAEPNDFQPPRGGPRVPAIRSSEELRRIQQEEEARRAARRRQNEASDVIYAPPSAGAGAGAEPGATDSNSAASASNRTPSGAESHANGNSRESKSEEKVPDAESESLALLQQRLEQLSRECERRQQESFELRSRWAQAEDDAERYMKILQQFWDADHRLRDASFEQRELRSGEVRGSEPEMDAAFVLHSTGLGGAKLGRPQQWWEWRELLVGVILWATLTTSVQHCVRRWRRRRRPRLLTMVLKDIFVTFTAFVLTAQPCLWLWAFLFGPLRCLVPGQAHPPVRWEELTSLAILLWLLLRSLYICWHGRTQRLYSQQRLDAVLAALVTAPSEDLSMEMDFEQDGQGLSPEAVEEMHRLRKALLDSRLAELRKALHAPLRPQSLHLFVRRSQVLQDSLSIFWQCPATELLAPNMSVSFDGEKGIDAGGLLRDWFDSIAMALVDEASPLAAEADGLAPRGPDSGYGQQELRGFVALGRFLATAVLRGHPLPLQLSSLCCKRLLMAPVSLSDLMKTDPDFFRHRVRPLQEPGGLEKLETALGEPLTFMSAPGGSDQVRALLPMGHLLRVHEGNRPEYLRLLSQERLVGGRRKSLAALQQGFWDVLPLHLLQRQRVQGWQLSLLISGCADPDPEEWRLHSSTRAANAPQKKVVEWFWDAVQSDLTAEQRCRLLRFATGSSRPPPGGFADLRPPFAVEVTSLGSEQHLPTAHTCINKLVLHFYSSKTQLLEKLLTALVDESFGTP
ncbi:unnamed protein product [Effrenium voratum]|uniref:HECT domain-containing protein n=1 Tax=Effrenium voratum TaxID=2562239 RepID=A0AA36MN13_9DINO|nr:unnamed protein product [Effrenium voratum]